MTRILRMQNVASSNESDVVDMTLRGIKYHDQTVDQVQAPSGPSIVASPTPAATKPILTTTSAASKSIGKRKAEDNAYSDVSDGGFDLEIDETLTHGPRNPGRAPKRTEEERKQELEDDSWVKSFTPTSVTCKGCAHRVKMNPDRSYATKDWESHKKKCAGIVGQKLVRVEGIKKQKTLTKVRHFDSVRWL